MSSSYIFTNNMAFNIEEVKYAKIIKTHDTFSVIVVFKSYHPSYQRENDEAHCLGTFKNLDDAQKSLNLLHIGNIEKMGPYMVINQSELKYIKIEKILGEFKVLLILKSYHSENSIKDHILGSFKTLNQAQIFLKSIHSDLL